MALPRRSTLGLGVALAAPGLVSLLAIPASVPSDVAAPLYVVAVATAAAVGGPLAGALAVAAAFVAYDYFFTAPRNQLLHVATGADITGLSAFALAAVCASVVVAREGRARRSAESARAASERSARRIARLERIAAILLSTARREDVAGVLLEHAQAETGASAGMVALLSDDGLTLHAISHAPTSGQAAREWREFPLALPTPVGDAIRTREPVVVANAADRERRYPELRPIHREALQAGIVALPLLEDGRPLGALALVLSEGSALEGDGLAFAFALAGLGTQALSRARLYEREREARLEAERASKQLVQLERAQREFVTNAAHEFRSPLAVIRGAIEILQAGGKDEPETRDRFLAHIERQTSRLTRLAIGLLTLARVESGAACAVPTPLALGPLLAQLADEVGGDVRVACPEGLVLETEPELLRNTLENLVENAVKYGDRKPVEVTARRRGVDVVVEVRDGGPGIEPSLRERVFDRFDRGGLTDGEGFGLGLAIAERAARALGGSLTLEPRPGGGTLARVTIRDADFVPVRERVPQRV